MLWRDLRVIQVFGANTDVGKTILSTILCKALAKKVPSNRVLYLKPISTGPQSEADDHHIRRYVPGLTAKCLKQYSVPASPHIAALHDDPHHELRIRAGKLNPADWSLVEQVKASLTSHHQAGGQYALLETAGGPLSPVPSGSAQADLYRPLRLPVVLIGDAKLGGISTTISAFESLHIRGYNVASVLLFDIPKWGNAKYLEQYFQEHNVNVYGVPEPPQRDTDEHRDAVSLRSYYDHVAESKTLGQVIEKVDYRHWSEVYNLSAMPENAESIIWHPFRQYGLPQKVTAIDSAYGDYFETYDQENDTAMESVSQDTPGLHPAMPSAPTAPLLKPLFDASASWWTQGLGHGNPNLALTAAHAAGRYGHVMFANAVHQPALDLAVNLQRTLQNRRLARIFYTDNGSTGMEVGVKMALRASCQRYGWSKHDDQIGILGLKGSYHGDTIGAMNASEPSPFNDKVDWYQPWGHWFSPPEVKFVKGEWQVQLPHDMPREAGATTIFSSLEKIFDFSTRDDDVQFYKDYISHTLTHLTHHQQRKFGALILEPLIMGAGGMIFVDPLFQRVLVQTIRADPRLINPHVKERPTAAESIDWSGVPIVADEVFTGLYRLGRASSSSFWQDDSSVSDVALTPDISCHAKLLTGGLLPLAVTTASDSIFQTFYSDSKADALLHGHSYTAHAVGCAVANKSLHELGRISQSALNGADLNKTNVLDACAWDRYRLDWDSRNTFSFYSTETLNRISHHELVVSCWSLGTVLAVTLASSTSGYNSLAAVTLQKRLLTTLDANGRGVHSRTLGDVIYFMTGLETRSDAVRILEQQILTALNAELEGANLK